MLIWKHLNSLNMFNESLIFEVQATSQISRNSLEPSREKTRPFLGLCRKLLLEPLSLQAQEAPGSTWKHQLRILGIGQALSFVSSTLFSRCKDLRLRWLLRNKCAHVRTPTVQRICCEYLGDVGTVGCAGFNKSIAKIHEDSYGSFITVGDSPSLIKNMF